MIEQQRHTATDSIVYSVRYVSNRALKSDIWHLTYGIWHIGQITIDLLKDETEALREKGIAEYTASNIMAGSSAVGLT